jgi:natural product precursor
MAEKELSEKEMKQVKGGANVAIKEESMSSLESSASMDQAVSAKEPVLKAPVSVPKP